MTRYYDRDGERVEARDVLDGEELRDYYESLRNRPRARTPRGPQRRWIDELGYDELGNWHPEHDPEEFR